MEELIQLIVKSYGILGVLILAPFFAAYLVWKDNKALRLELTQVQNQRVKETQEITRSLLEAAVEDSAFKKETNLLLERMGETLDRLERS